MALGATVLLHDIELMARSFFIFLHNQVFIFRFITMFFFVCHSVPIFFCAVHKTPHPGSQTANYGGQLSRSTGLNFPILVRQAFVGDT